MAGYAFPTTAYNSRAVSPKEYEDLVSAYTPDGVVGPPSLPALVYADSTLLGVKVRANRAALIRGLRWESGSTEVTITISPNNASGTTRIDLVVLRLSRNPWTVSLAVVQGVAAATPTAPSPTYGEDTSTGVWELPLFEVTVPYNDTVTDPAQVRQVHWWVGRDGQIQCLPGVRPPHEPGRMVVEYPSGAVWVSTGTAWLRAVEDAAGLVTPVSGINFPNRVLYRRNGWVTLGVTIWRPNAAFASGSVTRVGTVPDGFRPLTSWPFVGVVPSTGQVFTGSVETDGQVLFNPGAQSILADRYCWVATVTWPVA